MKKLNLNSNKLKILSRVFAVLTIISAIQATIAFIWEFPTMQGLPVMLSFITIMLSYWSDSKKKEESAKKETAS